jgi:hypothetical protein
VGTTGWLDKVARWREQVLEDDQEDAFEEASREQAGMLGEARAQKVKTAAESYEKRQMLWKGMVGKSWTGLVQEWGVPQVEALQLQKSIAALMREMGPRLGDLHLKESTGLGRESKVLPEKAMGMLEAAKIARRLREPGWCGEKGQGRWQAKKLLEWAAKELATSRRDLELQYGDIQDWAQREAMERRMDDSLLRWLGLDRPPRQRVRHKVWKKQLANITRQLMLGADGARKETEPEMPDVAELYNVVEEDVEGAVVRGPSPEAGPEPAGGGEEWEEQEWEYGELGCRHWCQPGGDSSRGRGWC